eukprot:TRINITY_DN2016_c0_g2_i5.p1 TRINITY_DN2016_c0_g2~~TRINITY_DN2016_c0_g2_i5.p1  ORF type:complete len:714 (+),score=146.34 TRINITY_DN2016_c0_g2_i5:292-2142(+)
MAHNQGNLPAPASSRPVVTEVSIVDMDDYEDDDADFEIALMKIPDPISTQSSGGSSSSAPRPAVRDETETSKPQKDTDSKTNAPASGPAKQVGRELPTKQETGSSSAIPQPVKRDLNFAVPLAPISIQTVKGEDDADDGDAIPETQSFSQVSSRTKSHFGAVHALHHTSHLLSENHINSSAFRYSPEKRKVPIQMSPEKAGIRPRQNALAFKSPDTKDVVVQTHERLAKTRKSNHSDPILLHCHSNLLRLLMDDCSVGLLALNSALDSSGHHDPMQSALSQSLRQFVSGSHSCISLLLNLCQFMEKTTDLTILDKCLVVANSLLELCRDCRLACFAPVTSTSHISSEERLTQSPKCNDLHVYGFKCSLNVDSLFRKIMVLFEATPTETCVRFLAIATATNKMYAKDCIASLFRSAIVHSALASGAPQNLVSSTIDLMAKLLPSPEFQTSIFPNAAKEVSEARDSPRSQGTSILDLVCMLVNHGYDQEQSLPSWKVRRSSLHFLSALLSQRQEATLSYLLSQRTATQLIPRLVDCIFHESQKQQYEREWSDRLQDVFYLLSQILFSIDGNWDSVLHSRVKHVFVETVSSILHESAQKDNYLFEICSAFRTALENQSQ